MPAPAHRFEDPEGDQPDILVYTAAQLREYATEAVMAEREEWRDLVQRAWRVLEIECPREPITDELLAALVNTDSDLTTPSETSSER